MLEGMFGSIDPNLGFSVEFGSFDPNFMVIGEFGSIDPNSGSVVWVVSPNSGSFQNN